MTRNPGLWDWAVEAYGRAGVADACLELQDTAGQNTCLLLWAGWSAATGRAADEDTLEATAETARAWDEAAIQPLRAVRRALKIAHPDMAVAARETVRDKVKAAERLAERQLLEALEALSPAPSGPARPPLKTLVAAARTGSGMVPRKGLETLAAHLST